MSPVSSYTDDSKSPPGTLNDGEFRVFIASELRGIRAAQKDQGATLDKLTSDVTELKEHRTVTKARAGRISLSQLSTYVGIVAVAGGVIWSALIAPHQEEMRMADVRNAANLRVLAAEANSRMRSVYQVIQVMATEPDRPISVQPFEPITIPGDAP